MSEAAARLNLKLCPDHGYYGASVCPKCGTGAKAMSIAHLVAAVAAVGAGTRRQGDKETRGAKPKHERLARKPNRTEERMFTKLEAEREHREDLIRFEGITLRFNLDGIHAPSRYTPDFFVCEHLTGRRRCIEVKGAQIWPKDLEKFKGARAAWGAVFEFELWQWEDGAWTLLH